MQPNESIDDTAAIVPRSNKTLLLRLLLRPLLPQPYSNNIKNALEVVQGTL